MALSRPASADPESEPGEHALNATSVVTLAETIRTKARVNRECSAGKLEKPVIVKVRWTSATPQCSLKTKPQG